MPYSLHSSLEKTVKCCLKHCAFHVPREVAVVVGPAMMMAVVDLPMMEGRNWVRKHKPPAAVVAKND